MPSKINNVMELFDLTTIGGMQFNVQSSDNSELKSIKVIKAELVFEIIRAHTLLLDDPHCEVQELVDLFTGFTFTPFDISWYTTSNPADLPNKAIQQAIRENNEVVIVELIPPPTKGDYHARPPRQA